MLFLCLLHVSSLWADRNQMQALLLLWVSSPPVHTSAIFFYFTHKKTLFKLWLFVKPYVAVDTDRQTKHS